MSINNATLTEKLFKYNKVLFVGAHPDDIEFYCGALVQMLNKNGARLTFAIATKGGKGKKGKAGEKLMKLRSSHQVDAANILGGADVLIYNYPDKTLSAHITDFASDIKKLIEKIKPEAIFSWDPDYIYNPHPDHQASANAVIIAANGNNIIYYGTKNPDIWVGFGDNEYNILIKSIRAHKTETPWYYYYPIVGRLLHKKLTSQGKQINQKYAETFRCAESENPL